MLASVFRFGDRQVREMMTPRTEIVFIERGTQMGEFLKIYAENAHTRFPGYKGSTDDVIGILSAKDILRAMSANEMASNDPVTTIIRDAYFVPETKRIAELFDELRMSGNQMAIAIDEYGGIAGLVSKFGGANSHMTIRCAELGLPAAIGGGEQTFERISSAERVELDAASQLIRPIYG